jgi:hypothetical protein
MLLILAAVAATSAAAAGYQRPRAVAVILSLAVSVFAVQSAVHSVHHLGHPHEAERCPILWASQHAPGDLPTVTIVERPTEEVAELVATVPVSFVPDTALRPDQGRAPPSPRA